MALSIKETFISSRIAKTFILALIILLVMLVWVYQLTGDAHATTGSWGNIQTPKITWENSSFSETLRPQFCESRQDSKVLLYNSLRTIAACSIKVGPLEFTGYTAYLDYSYTYGSAVKYPGDSRFYTTSAPHWSPSQFRSVPNSNKMIEFNTSAEIHIHDNVPAHFTKVDYGTDGQNEYLYTPEIAHTVERSDGQRWDIGQRRAISSNGKWLAFVDQNIGIIRVNLNTYETVRLTDGSTGSNMNGLLDVSDNGAVALYNGYGYMSALIFDAKDCGTNNISSAPNPNPCPYFNAGDYITSYTSDLGGLWLIDIDLSDDGHKFRMKACVTVSPYECKVYTLSNLESSTTYTQTDRLDYLALGDSYSSGEGDTVRNPASGTKYYRNNTNIDGDSSKNIPREKCHVSTRSYPYILSKGMALGDPKNDSTTKWQSVACSGALTLDAVPDDKDSDLGQGGRLKDIDSRKELKSQALNEFVPGRVKQIEFVKKYRPKVITLTMGGNDVGFEKVLTACAAPSTSDPTCYYATSIGKSWQAKQILDKYGDLKDLYTSLYDASGKQAKIYVLGYPQFISADEPASCGWNIGSLNADERASIAAYLELMNNVIEKAANAAGVKYVNTENSLGGGRLCDEGQKYVTGVAGLPLSVKNERQESFHPNAKGHFEIAMTIWDEVNHESLLDYNICQGSSENICPDTSATKESVSIPSYLGTPAIIGARYVDLTTGQVKKENPLTVKTDSYTLRPQSSANITMHSDPIDLGDFTVNADGSLNEDVTVPDTVPAGYHTLIVSGETYSGEPVQYEQVVLVTGTNPNDLDDNGINDSTQSCGAFMTESNQDTDIDGIDDACDPEISNTPQLYRVRTGDADRQYNGTVEHEDYLYVERNTRASAITGISGDYDPDGDGWAVVGVSQGTPYSTSSVPDTAPAANFEVAGEGTNAKPYVYIRAGGYGCTSFTPTSLAKVQHGQSRTIKKVAYNTDKCRQESSDYDVDGNGQPDNTQPLYEAHQGITTKGEDSSRIYLYRNFYASEAQIGISDYTPTGTPAGNPIQPIQPWNLLASSKPNEYIPAFNKLAILEDGNHNPLPTILTKKLNGQCITYQPENTEIIKMTTQSTRYLKKLTSIPGGVSCE